MHELWVRCCTCAEYFFFVALACAKNSSSFSLFKEKKMNTPKSKPKNWNWSSQTINSWNFKYSLVLINRSPWNAIHKLHAPYNLIMILFSPINFAWMCRQMRIHETYECLINLHADTNTTFISLHFMQKKKNSYFIWLQLEGKSVLVMCLRITNNYFKSFFYSLTRRKR